MDSNSPGLVIGEVTAKLPSGLKSFLPVPVTIVKLPFKSTFRMECKFLLERYTSPSNKDHIINDQWNCFIHMLGGTAYHGFVEFPPPPAIGANVSQLGVDELEIVASSASKSFVKTRNIYGLSS